MRSIHPDLIRILHIGDCGTHHLSQMGCDPIEKIKSVKQRYKNNKVEFFPSNLKQEKRLEYNPRKSSPNGGFADSRDHALCKKNVIV